MPANRPSKKRRRHNATVLSDARSFLAIFTFVSPSAANRMIFARKARRADVGIRNQAFSIVRSSSVSLIFLAVFTAYGLDWDGCGRPPQESTVSLKLDGDYFLFRDRLVEFPHVQRHWFSGTIATMPHLVSIS